MAKALCASCGGACIAKCGRVNAWHWAHESRADCDSWAEGETEWHLWWKERAHEDEIEVAINNHRADIRRRDGLVIELQHSSISVEEIHERERFWGRMVWVIDGTCIANNFRIRNRGDYVSFRWKHPRRTFFQATRPIYIDLGPRVLGIRKLYGETPCGGWGIMRGKSSALQALGLRALTPHEAKAVVEFFVHWGHDCARFTSATAAARCIASICERNCGVSWAPQDGVMFMNADDRGWVSVTARHADDSPVADSTVESVVAAEWSE